MTQLVWHRGDLRTHDHPALNAAVEAGDAVGVVVLDSNILDNTSPRRRALFYENVGALRASYRDRGGELLIRNGLPWEELPALVEALRAEHVHAIRSYTPYGVHRDRRTEEALPVPIRWQPGNYVHEPGDVRTNDDQPYVVYSPYHRRWRSLHLPAVLEAPRTISGPSLSSVNLGRVPSEDSDVSRPEPGEDAARAALDEFLEQRLSAYHEDRNLLDGSGSSRLSIYLNIGVLSPRLAAVEADRHGGKGAGKWIAEIAWRDWYMDLVYHYPHMLESAFDPRWQELEWVESRERFEAWRDGRTGIPAVDAAMRQLRGEGWISNRARLLSGQFLVKQLRVPWQWGEEVYKKWLLDGDTAQNTGNWQWVAGLGVDNAPYFRVFNPATRGKKHDPEAAWVRRWVPESDGSHDPAEDAIVDLKEARAEYLDEAKRVSDGERPKRPPPRDPPG